jgi:hypothetical protein
MTQIAARTQMTATLLLPSKGELMSILTALKAARDAANAIMT